MNNLSLTGLRDIKANNIFLNYLNDIKNVLDVFALKNELTQIIGLPPQTLDTIEKCSFKHVHLIIVDECIIYLTILFIIICKQTNWKTYYYLVILKNSPLQYKQSVI